MPPRNASVEGRSNRKSGFAVGDGFRQASGLVADRQRAEFLGVHLWLSPHGSKRDGISVRSLGWNPPRLSVIETDRDPDRVGSAPMRIDQRLLDLGLAAAGDNDLAAGLDDGVGG